jgi:taurine dioxygenase
MMGSIGASVDVVKVAEPSIRKLTGTIGAEMIGARMVSDSCDMVEKIRHAAITHRVLAVRDQFLGPEELLIFGKKLGDIMMTRGVAPSDRYPDLLKITNPGKAKALSENWHTDGTTSECPPSLSVLAAQELPEAGGDTLFVDMGYAYRTLSSSYQKLLRGRRGHHVSHLPKSDARFLNSNSQFEAWHPLVRTIPETGEYVLFPGFPNIMDEIEGMTLAESRSILNFLFAHATRHDGMYRHRWLSGDVLVWDNRSTMHYAVHDYGDAPRTLYRVMIRGERPFEAPYSDDAHSVQGSMEGVKHD